MMSREKKNLIIFFIIFALVALGNGFLLFLISEKTNETIDILAMLQKADASEARVRTLAKSLQETEQERLALNSYFVQKQESVKFIEQIERLGKKANVSLSVMSVTVLEKTDELRLDIATKGGFEDTFYLLSLLESLPYKVVLNRVEISKKDEHAGSTPVGESANSLPTWGGSFTLMLKSFIK